MSTNKTLKITVKSQKIIHKIHLNTFNQNQKV